MDVFITGGTGFIGRAIIAELCDAGHRVTALNRTADKAGHLRALGAEPHAGDLLDPATYAAEAGAADAVIHAAFDYSAAGAGDVAALEALLDATADREARLIYTSGCWVVGDTGGAVLDDDASTDRPAEIVAWRVDQERKVLRANSGDRVATVIRPGVVYGRTGGLTARMFQSATRDGAAEHIGDGSNHWSMIHVEDLARLYRAAMERGPGGVTQAVDGESLTVSAVAEAASEAADAGGRTDALPLDAAREKLGPVADAMCLDQRLESSSARSLGWEPAHVSFARAAPRAFEEWRVSRR